MKEAKGVSAALTQSHSWPALRADSPQSTSASAHRLLSRRSQPWQKHEMASTAIDEEARRSRIIDHMNRCHTRELTYYLRHYAAVPIRNAIANPSLRHLTLREMRIRSAGTDYTVPFEPPLEAWSEVKSRIIAMDATARSALSISDIYITEFARPQGFDCVVFGLVVSYFACVATLPWVVPDTAPWAAIDAVFPGGADWYRWIVAVLFLPVLAIHTTESCLFDRKLRRHDVYRWTALWWMWMLSCFIEGVMAFRRLDAIIAEKRAIKQDNKK